jgi:tRNA dimethylallyltransferase
MRRALLIAGPTASGKSALALSLARRRRGVVINADALQVYADLRVLTARPTPEEESQAPHALYGFVDAADAFSAGRWLRAAAPAIEAAWAQGRLPIVVGGTGLHFMALTTGLAPVPDIPSAVSADARAEAAADPAAAHARLTKLDPAAAARIQPGDPVRIARALAVFDATGLPLSAFQAETTPTLAAGAWTGLALTPRRADLYAKIEARFSVMLADGALEEARALWARRLDPLLPCMKAHGMPWLARHFAGEIGLNAAAAGAILDTRHYAKRQLTWIRNQMRGWKILDENAPAERVAMAERLLEAQS